MPIKLNQTQVARRVLKRQRQKNEQQAAFLSGAKKHEAWAEGQRKGQSEGRPAAG